MGISYVTLEIANPASPDNTETLDFLVDSGATYTVVPEELLTRLGIRPLTEDTFRLADGQKITRRKGGAVFKFGERIGVSDVVFGEAGDINLLGALTLESLGLLLDPLKRELRELPLLLSTLLRVDD